MMQTKTAPMGVRFENIPVELRERRQWVCWSWTWNKKKWDKPPTQPNGKPAKSNDPSTWSSFSDLALSATNYDGIGFVFNNDYIGIDLDDCRDLETGELTPTAQYIVGKLDSYTEVSPSGKGVKIFCKGTLPQGRRADHSIGLEMYQSGRYFTITGHRVPGTPTTINERQEAIAEIHRQFLQPGRDMKNDDPEETRELALSALDALKTSRADHYSDWLGVGMALHSLDSSLLPDWEKWSEQSAKFVPGECSRKWATFNGGGVGIASLFHWAKEDGWQRPRKRKPSTNGKHGETSGRTIRNFEIAEYDDKGKAICTPIPMKKILDNIGDWPRRVGTALFIEDRKEISWLSKSAALTGWLGSRTGNPPDFRKSPGFHTEVEVFEELRRTAKAYHDVETLPHHPRLENVYYTCGEITPGDGKKLNELVDRFNPATAIDRDLIVALLVSPGWGSSGNRPAFSITSDDGRGVGKSTLAMLAGRLWGGRIEVSPDEPVEVIKQRLLSAEAMTKRVANIDNVKSMKFSNAGLEALITTDIISGKRMFHGEAQRPNNLTWITTMNGVSFATDMAQRVITIKINRPTYSGNWQDEAEDFIDRNRDSLISDCIGFLMRPEDYQLASFTRWGNWERDVLSRLPDPAEAQRVIMERQAQSDAEGEESSDFEHAIREKLWEASYDPETAVVFLPSRLTADVLSQVMGERFGLTKASRVINQRINEGGLRHISKNTAKSLGRGFIWRGPQSDHAENISTDLESRLNREWRDR